MFVQPPFLKKNDTVGIVAPARKVLKKDMDAAAKILESWGLKVVFGKNLFAENHQFAGTDAQRTEDLQNMLDNPEIKAVFCARGGYGTVRIIDSLNFDMFTKYPKWIVGYSDITVLHTHINKQLKIQTLHSAMPMEYGGFTLGCSALESIKSALFGEAVSYSVIPHELNKVGTAKGVLMGGNLSILYSLQATASEIDTNGVILFIEDLEEYLYHVDRMMENLKRSGKLQNIKALIVGGMNDMNDNTILYGQTAEEIIFEKIKEASFPVVFNFPAGHVKENNNALIFGKTVELSVQKDKVELSYID